MGSSGLAMAKQTKTKRARRKPKYGWDADKVKSLRQHMALTQAQLSEEMGVRQQTISEWETGLYQPRGASAKLLNLIAERTGFEYGEGGSKTGG